MTTNPLTVLVLEDRAPDRLYLTVLLRHRGFTVLEAANGEEGLVVARQHRLDLVISDVLMPVMDGFEFVRQLRQLPAGADVPVIFYTATYHELEARELAEECGVVEVMTKPAEPQAILARVDAVMARGRDARPMPVADEPFERHHRRLATDKLVEKVQQLEASEQRIAAIVAIGQRFLEKHDLVELLNRVCETVRDVTAAEFATVGLLSDDLDRTTLLFTSGCDAATTDFLRASGGVASTALEAVRERRSSRESSPAGRTTQLLLLPSYASIHSSMVVPMASGSRVYGFFTAAGKAGGGAFTDVDEVIARTLGAQAGVAYENALLIKALEAQAAMLRENEAMVDFALSSARIGVHQRDLVTNQMVSSSGLAEILRLGRHTTFSDIHEVLHPDDQPAARAAVERAIREGGDFSIDARVVSEQGAPGHVQIRGRVLPNADGHPARVLSTVIDVTEHRSLEAQFRQAQKMEAIGQLAGGVAHDFNNILTAIQGYIRFLMPTLTGEQQREDLTEIMKATERAGALTRQLLAFSRRQPQELRLVDLNLLVRDLASMLQRLIGAHITLATDFARGLPQVRVDAGQMEQVIMNLVVNARDAMPSGGEVRIRTRHAVEDGSDWVRMDVIDVGTGMTAETRARLFEPFFTTKAVGVGTGLGLATVFGVVAQCGGSIDVESAVGAGSTFSIRLPAARDSAAEEEPAVPAAPRGSESILLVEDEQAVRFLVRTILDRAGYSVVEAASLDEAVSQARQRNFDLLLADVIMPGGNGPDVERAVNAIQPDIRVLFMSGYAQESVLNRDERHRHVDFLSKPFTVEALGAKVREVLDR